MRCDERVVGLTPREFDLLEYLMRNVDLTRTREVIEEHVWGARFESSSNVVDVFVRNSVRPMQMRSKRYAESGIGCGRRRSDFLRRLPLALF